MGLWHQHLARTMADSPHVSDVVDTAEVAAFLKRLRGDMTNQAFADAAGLSYGTTQKWFTVNVGELTAVNLLKAVVGLGASAELATQVEQWRAGKRLTPAVMPLTPAASSARLAAARKKKGRSRASGE